MPMLRFKVLFPAMMPPVGPQPPMPDPMPMYAGGISNGNQYMPAFGNAVVTGGAKYGNKWLGCMYICPPFVIPGVGEVEEVG